MSTSTQVDNVDHSVDDFDKNSVDVAKHHVCVCHVHAMQMVLGYWTLVRRT